jgi:hypothetical protein
MLGFARMIPVVRLTPFAAFACLVVQASPIAAQQEIQLMALPATYTDVIDAFDGDDTFSVNVGVGFVRSSRSGVIQRESREALPDGGTTTTLTDVAEHSRVTNSLRLGFDVGIYKDLAL